jgi:hypothetical protein
MRELSSFAKVEEAKTEDVLNKSIYKIQAQTYDECASMIEASVAASNVATDATVGAESTESDS